MDTKSHFSQHDCDFYGKKIKREDDDDDDDAYVKQDGSSIVRCSVRATLFLNDSWGLEIIKTTW